jgi:hypothetical protein
MTYVTFVWMEWEKLTKIIFLVTLLSVAVGTNTLYRVSWPQHSTKDCVGYLGKWFAECPARTLGKHDSFAECPS